MVGHGNLTDRVTFESRRCQVEALGPSGRRNRKKRGLQVGIGKGGAGGRQRDRSVEMESCRK